MAWPEGIALRFMKPTHYHLFWILLPSSFGLMAVRTSHVRDRQVEIPGNAKVPGYSIIMHSINVAKKSVDSIDIIHLSV